ncbi:hypothetical protein MKZ38_007838 [Zalerion maritima]|uniref:Dihydrofolate reductase n=1 Tax=Zalerion maritima TaxID=339359 RepID=A0AAD5RIK5_9PEZI|nr:hypothetical protein MKZ38_007838 [Zalerion maritima]
MNAIIMGRKTWESIPPRFRPLKDRLNIVISRSFSGQPSADISELDHTKEPVKLPSLHAALQFLKSSSPDSVGRVFVIGGGQIYDAALTLPETRRVLLTSIFSDFECDTHFPIKFVSSSAPGHAEWQQRSKQDLDQWTGEQVPAGLQEENGTTYEFQMWERET